MNEITAGVSVEGSFDPVSLDPFEYFPTRKSRIGGLAGDDSFSDPSYAFHTTYQACEPGPATFTIWVHHLAATCGTLVLRVNVIPVDLRFDAKLAKTANVPLAALSKNDGEVSIQIAAQPGMLYALLGQVYEDTDAVASDISITLRQIAGNGLTANDLRADAQSSYGLSAAPGSPHLLSAKSASLLTPVSQVATPAQLQEKVFSEWLGRLGRPDEPLAHLWHQIYVLQSLRVYGMLEGGARGLGIGVTRGPLPAVMAAAGCLVVAQSGGEDREPQLDGLRYPDFCDDVLFDQQVQVVPRQGDLPDGIGQFDFVWSIQQADSQGAAGTAAQFVLQSLECLNAGGLAIHTMMLGLGHMALAGEQTEGAMVPQGAIDRLALDLISHGHMVSQIRYDREGLVVSRWGRGRPTTKVNRQGIEVVPFGLIVRKGDG